MKTDNETVYEKARPQDASILTEIRQEVIQIVWKTEPGTDLSAYYDNTLAYFSKALADENHTAFLAYNGNELIGCGGISYYDVMPTYGNPSGRQGLIMNMYVSPDFRRRGIARNILKMLIQDALEKGVTYITLEATETGKLFYKKCGFKKDDDAMVYRNDR